MEKINIPLHFMSCLVIFLMLVCFVKSSLDHWICWSTVIMIVTVFVCMISVLANRKSHTNGVYNWISTLYLRENNINKDMEMYADLWFNSYRENVSSEISKCEFVRKFYVVPPSNVFRSFDGERMARPTIVFGAYWTPCTLRSVIICVFGERKKRASLVAYFQAFFPYWIDLPLHSFV